MLVQKDHYKSLFVKNKNFEPINLINDYGVNFNMGNVLKYVARHGLKPGESPKSDLLKAVDYLQFEIDRLKQLQLSYNRNNVVKSLLVNSYNPSYGMFVGVNGLFKGIYLFYKDNVFALKPYEQGDIDFCAELVNYCCNHIPCNRLYMDNDWFTKYISVLKDYKTKLITLIDRYYANV